MTLYEIWTVNLEDGSEDLHDWTGNYEDALGVVLRFQDYPGCSAYVREVE